MRMLLVLLATISLAFSQQTQTTAPPTGGGTTTPPPAGGGTRPPVTTPTPQPTRPSTPPRPLFVTGQVVMSDGSEFTDRPMIERVCGANNIRPEGYTDSKGYFSFQLGANQMAFADASTGLVNVNDMAGLGQSAATGPDPFGTGGFAGTPEQAFWNCELRAKLAGYRSSTVLLAGKRFGDSPNVGTIILYSSAKVAGLMESATAGLAPKDSRKAYEKGIEQMQRGRLDQAEKELRKAVELYPKHAPAWLEIGKLMEAKEQIGPAREAYEKAVAADASFVPPHVQLYRVAFKELNWQALADRTDTVVRLNPYEYPEAYYYNGVANYQLKNYEQAEKSARRALEMDPKNRNPKSHYVLGWVLVQQRKLEEAGLEFRTYLALAPESPEKKNLEDVLGQIDRALSSQQ